MLYFVFELDEEKIIENGFNLETVYKNIDEAYHTLGCEKVYQKGNAYFYTRKKDFNDSDNLWRVAAALKRSPYFYKNLKNWKYFVENNKKKVIEKGDLLKDSTIIDKKLKEIAI